jgi:AcrR family transcriptional regulator
MSLLEALSPEKERQILDGAARAFAADGYEGASMSRIAAVAGVSKGTLYNYFAGKRELFAAFVHRECSGQITLIFDDIDANAALEAVLPLICRRMLDMLTSDTGLLIYRMVVAEAAKFPELAEAFFEAGPRRALAAMARWIEGQCRAGRLEVTDPSFAAEQLFGLMQTRVLMRRRLRLAQSVDDAELDRVVAAGVWVFLRAYAAPGHAGSDTLGDSGR